MSQAIYALALQLLFRRTGQSALDLAAYLKLSSIFKAGKPYSNEVELDYTKLTPILLLKI